MPTSSTTGSNARSGRPAVVLLSGGLDSATTLAMARESGFTCHTLAFDYGQRHRHELDSAVRVARSLGAATHRTLSIDLRSIGGSALTADIDVPKHRSHEQMATDVPMTYVPARNIIFLSLAAAAAEVLNSRDIYIGVNAIDYSGYPDCRPEFIEAFQRAVTLGTRAGTEPGNSGGLRIHVPLVRLTKAQIIREGVRLGVDYSLTHSCYDPVRDAGGIVRACGSCDSCQLRREGFMQAGVSDPTPYVPETGSE